MKQTNQTTTLPTTDLQRHRFGEYNFVNLGTGHQTSDIAGHPYTQDHVLSCSATKNAKNDAKMRMMSSYNNDEIMPECSGRLECEERSRNGAATEHNKRGYRKPNVLCDQKEPS